MSLCYLQWVETPRMRRIAMGKDFGGYLVRACMKSGGISGVVLLVYMIFSPNHFLEAVPSWKVILILLTFSSSFAVLRLFAELFMERVIYLCDTYARVYSTAFNRRSKLRLSSIRFWLVGSATYCVEILDDQKRVMLVAGFSEESIGHLKEVACKYSKAE